LKDPEDVLEVSDVENGEDELDVRVVSNAVCERETASFALARLVARSESSVEDSVRHWTAIFSLVEIPLVRFELCDRDRLPRREHRELNMFAENEK
jgi:hypothetical protein